MWRFISFVFLVLLISCAAPVARFTYSTDSDIVPTRMVFKNESRNADAFTWSFGDGTYSDSTQTEHAYYQSGMYEVNLVARKGKKSRVYQQKIFLSPPPLCRVLVETNYGNMILELNESTPIHRDNFIALVKSGFYDGILFHRVVPGFVIQAGDPATRHKPFQGVIPRQQLEAEFRDSLRHFRGALSAARMPDQVNPEKKSSPTQFYIVSGSEVSSRQLNQAELQKGLFYTAEETKKYTEHGGTPFLDGDYTVFGRLISGFDTLDKISRVQTNAADTPESDVLIVKMTEIK